MELICFGRLRVALEIRLVVLEKPLIHIENSLVGGLVPRELALGELEGLGTRGCCCVVHILVAVFVIVQHFSDGVSPCDVTLKLSFLLLLDSYLGGK